MQTISKKIVYRIVLKFITPVSVSSGNEGTTDSDVMVDFEGNPFIPGASLAGAFRAYLQTQNKSEMELLFGFTSNEKGNDGKMSSLFISDLEFDGEPQRIIRDSVALDDNKISYDGAKFDFEALEGKCIKGHFYMEVTIRDESKEEVFKKMIDEIFAGIKLHEIRLGSKKTRGYGIVEVDEVKKKEFESKNYLNYADCYNESSWNNVDKYHFGETENDGNYVHIRVPLELVGGISIRQYAVKKNSPDFEHITSNGKPVIPGTSFMGALRHRTKTILDSLNEEYNIFNKEELMNEMFGYVNGKKAHISNIVIDEATIENAKPLTITRTGISRFESSAKNGALYQEKTYVGGNFDLCISVKKGNPNTDTMIGLLLLAIKDLQNGYLAVGGQTSVGRGIFKGKDNNKIEIDGQTDKVNEYIVNAIKKYTEVC